MNFEYLVLSNVYMEGARLMTYITVCQQKAIHITFNQSSCCQSNCLVDALTTVSFYL